MLDKLNNLKPNRPKERNQTQKRVLCIIEGTLELDYIVKVFQLFGYSYDCYELSETYIRVAWGKKLSKNINIVRKTKKGCTFEGGSHKESKVPFPAISAFELYNKDIEFFDSVIVLFDGDKDKNNEVENYFSKQFTSLENTSMLLVSTPCFESTLIDFCSCGVCRVKMNKLLKEKENCSEYKDGLSFLECFKNFRTGKGIVTNLEQKSLDTLNDSKLIKVNQIIQNYMCKQ